jgi:hypothetical protein
MDNPDRSDREHNVWPPSIDLNDASTSTLTSSRIARNNRVSYAQYLFVRASVWCSILSIACMAWAVLVDYLWRGAIMPDYALAHRISYDCQVGFEAAGVSFGLVGWKGRLGRAGRVVQVLGICMVIGWPVVYHVYNSSGDWPWNGFMPFGL